MAVQEPYVRIMKALDLTPYRTYHAGLELLSAAGRLVAPDGKPMRVSASQLRPKPVCMKRWTSPENARRLRLSRKSHGKKTQADRPIGRRDQGKALCLIKRVTPKRIARALAALVRE